MAIYNSTQFGMIITPRQEMFDSYGGNASEGGEYEQSISGLGPDM